MLEPHIVLDYWFRLRERDGGCRQWRCHPDLSFIYYSPKLERWKSNWFQTKCQICNTCVCLIGCFGFLFKTKTKGPRRKHQQVPKYTYMFWIVFKLLNTFVGRTLILFPPRSLIAICTRCKHHFSFELLFVTTLRVKYSLWESQYLILYLLYIAPLLSPTL